MILWFIQSNALNVIIFTLVTLIRRLVLTAMSNNTSTLNFIDIKLVTLIADITFSRVRIIEETVGLFIR